MTLRKFSLLFLFCAVVLGAGVLGWYLLTRDPPEEEIKVGNIGSQSTSNGVHMLEGKLNNTTVFSGITWVDEVISVMLLLTSFIVYKLIRYKCKTPAPPPTADPPVPPPPAAEPAPPPPQAQQAYQQFYPPPSYSSPYSVQLMADQAAASVKYAAKKAKVVNVVNAIESESEDETSGSDTTSVVVAVSAPAEKKRRNKPRTKKNHPVTDKENTATA